MSESRIAAVVCEGQTDVPIVRELIQAVWPEIEEVRCLQPQLDETDRAKGPAGWSQVKAWCERNAGSLKDVIDPDVGDPIALLLVIIDVDIAIAAGISNPPTRVGVYETKRLRDVMETWLREGKEKLPSALVLSTPVMSIETWIVAALFPKQRLPEQIVDPAGFLAKKGILKLSPTDHRPWKELHRYRSAALKVAHKVKQVRRACKEAERMLSSIEKLRARNVSS